MQARMFNVKFSIKSGVIMKLIHAAVSKCQSFALLDFSEHLVMIVFITALNESMS